MIGHKLPPLLLWSHHKLQYAVFGHDASYATVQTEYERFVVAGFKSARSGLVQVAARRKPLTVPALTAIARPAFSLPLGEGGGEGTPELVCHPECLVASARSMRAAGEVARGPGSTLPLGEGGGEGTPELVCCPKSLVWRARAQRRGGRGRRRSQRRDESRPYERSSQMSGDQPGGLVAAV